MPALPPDWRTNPAVAQAVLNALRAAKAARHPDWRTIARTEQLAPPGAWLVWMYLAGRGAGKTRSAAEWITERARTPRLRGALVGRTPADVRDVMIEGESGILACSRPDNMPVYEPTKRRLSWPNGTQATAYSAEVPSQLRGPQHHFAWADEAAAWTDAAKGDVVDTAWNNLMLGLRLGQDPRCVITTTPKANKLIRTLLDRASTTVTRGSTYDNLDNLAPSFRDLVLATYEGTRIGRQELLGEILDDVEGALWTLAMVDTARVDAAPDLTRVVVAVDPSGGEGENHDEQGIIVAGLGVDADLYVLADRSCRMSPHGWASRAVAAYHEFSADRIVAEKNFGGAMVESTIRAINPTVPVRMVTASRGKVQRAEPIAALYEKTPSRVKHVGAFPELEDQLTTWTPESGLSPDRLDALVWALTDLGHVGQGSAFLTALKAKAADDQVDVPSNARKWRETAAALKTREVSDGTPRRRYPEHAATPGP